MLSGSSLITLLAGLEAPTLVFFAWVVRKLGVHDTALAVLVQSVNPVGEKSLRAIVNEIQLEQARQQPTSTTNITNTSSPGNSA
jgi:hypothetical protein